MTKPELSIIIPAYNEAERISSTLEKMTKYFTKLGKSYEIIIVNDGSRDQTEEVITKAKPPFARIVSYGQNRGKGFAVKFGAKQAKGDWILFADADNSTPIEEFEKLFAETGKYEVIIGSRYVRGSQIAVKQGVPRIILSRIGNILVQLLILPGVQDTQCGFKLFSSSAAQKIFSRQTINGWGFDMEILKIARDNGYRIKEIPITWYNDDQSRIQSSRVFTKTLKELFVIFGNSLTGMYRPKNTN